MASTASLQTLFSSLGVKQPRAGASGTSLRRSTTAVGSKVWSLNAGVRENKKKGRSLTVVAAVGDVSSEGTTYLIAGAAAVALIGTAFPIFFSRKDLYAIFIIHFCSQSTKFLFFIFWWWVQTVNLCSSCHILAA